MRRFLLISIVMFTAFAAVAGETKFSLNLDAFKWSTNQDARTRARRAIWNDPMGRLQYQFEQQQAWIMRGTMPGGERASGLAVRVKFQNALPLHLVASSVRAGLDISSQDFGRIGPHQASDDELTELSLEEQLTELLGRRLVPQ
jgi:hypothetical protein